MVFEVIEYKRGNRMIHLSTPCVHEARDEFRWLNERKECHDSSMGNLAIERR